MWRTSCRKTSRCHTDGRSFPLLQSMPRRATPWRRAQPRWPCGGLQGVRDT
jgi:hypothetical protein